LIRFAWHKFAFHRNSKTPSNRAGTAGLALFSCPFFYFPMAYKFGVLRFETRARAFANFGN